jgi:hypothetical protein
VAASVQYTVYIDESGSFKPGPSGELGRHVVAAVALPLPHEEVVQRFRSDWEKAAAPFPLPIHVTEMRHPIRARALLKRQRHPGAAALDDKAVLDLSDQALNRLRAVIEEMASLPASRAVVCLQHGVPLPVQDRWADLVQAAADTCVLLASGAKSVRASVLFRIESRGPAGLDLGPSRPMLQALARRGIVREAHAVAVPKHPDDVGLQVADLVARGVGPGERAAIAVTRGQAWGFGAERARRILDRWAGCRLAGSALCTGARPETHGRLLRAAGCDPAAPPRRRIVDEITTELTARRLPELTLRCSLEGVRDAVRRAP